MSDHNIGAAIVDQMVRGIVEKHPDLLSGGRAMTVSAAFLLLCMRYKLDITLEEAADAYTDGGNDVGVDGLHIGDVVGDEVDVTLFQSKYYEADLRGVRAFPEVEIQKIVGTLRVLFDPALDLRVNPALAARVEEVRSFIREGVFPTVRVVLCSNGARWNESAQRWMDEAVRYHKGQVEFVYFNHDDILHILKQTKPADVVIQLRGGMTHEDIHFVRAATGRVSVQDVAKWFEEKGDLLLQKNVRRFLGLHGGMRVNRGIAQTLCEAPEKFYFCNNGITVVCDKLSSSTLQGGDKMVRLTNMQVVNGGQTCKVIHSVLQDERFAERAGQASVMLRIYQLPDDGRALVDDITLATNSQNPVDGRDLRSNDFIQKNLEKEVGELAGGRFVYKRWRDGKAVGSDTITSAAVAEAVLAVWRRKPHLARFRRAQYFGRFYDEIFDGLHAAQAVVAVLVFRYVESVRRRSAEDAPLFLPYASHFVAMVVGEELLAAEGVGLGEVAGGRFAVLAGRFEADKAALYARAVRRVAAGVEKLLNGDAHSLQKLSAVFRRSDLLDKV